MILDGPIPIPRLSRLRGLPTFVSITAFLGVVLCAISIVILANGVWKEVDAFAAANSDTMQWSLSQTEVELFALLVSVNAASDLNDPNLRDVRNRFNVLYSRIKLLREGQQFNGLRTDANVTHNLDVVFATLERYIPAIDGPDADLIAQLKEIDRALTGLRPLVREASLFGVRLFANDSDDQRATLGHLLARIGYLTLALVVALIAGIAILLAMFHRSTKAERAAGDAHHRLQEVIATSFDAIIAADIDGNVIEYNGAAERIFGYSRYEALESDVATLLVPDHMKQAHAYGMKRYREFRTRHVVGKGLVRMEARRKDGTIFPVEMSLSSTNHGGREIFVSYIRDISDRVAAEQELIRARDSAVSGEKAKAELLAVMSHEMRTPLNGILGTIELLKGTKLSPEQDKYLSAMNTSASLLLHHVNGVLNMSRAEAGQLELRPSKVDPSGLLQELVESQRHVIEGNGNKIFCDTFSAPTHIWVDALRLRQVILNLVGNANKFTRHGEIRVECDVIADSDQVEFRVIDTGIGIAEKDLEAVFEEFRTLDSSYSRQANGTGLGLAISRRLVRAMGGEIGVDSEPGEGSIFWVRLPIGEPRRLGHQIAELAEAKPESISTLAPISPLTVLLVEDNHINLLVARDMLQKCGHSVVEAHDGKEGVRRASQSKFDIILMDISMPELDGVAATRIIRDTKGPNQTTPIIALTAHALPEDAARFQAAGITSTLLKPLSMDSLRAAMTAVVKDAAGPMPVEPPPSIALVQADLSEQIGADKACRLLRSFRKEGEGLIARVTAPDWVTETPKTRADAVHKLAGSAAVLGATDLRGMLKELESLYRREEASAADALLPDLLAVWRKTQEEIAICLKDSCQPDETA